jgi:hypothetical protein
MRKCTIAVAKACSSRAFSETASTLKPNAVGVDRENRHLEFVASSSGYLGTGTITSSVKPSKDDLTNAERYLCSVSKLVVDSYNKRNARNH